MNPAASILEILCKDPSVRASNWMVSEGAVVDGCETSVSTASQDDAAGLAARFAAGEADALEQLVAAYQTRVERLALRLLGWNAAGDAEDVVQDVFLAALSNAKRLRGEHGLWPWLATITVNACRSHRRRAWVRQKFLRQTFAASVSPAADESAVANETSQRVRDAVSKLATRDREVIVLHYLVGMRSQDIATVLGLSTNAADVRLHRARARFKDLLQVDES